MAKEEPSYAQLTREVVHGSPEPLPVDEIYERVNALRSITTKNPKQTIRTAVGADPMIVNTGDGRYGWKTRVINGSKLRYTLRESDLLMEVLQYTDELFDALCPTYEAHELYKDLNPIIVKLSDGTETQFPLEDLYPGMWGTHATEEFWDWLKSQKPTAGDQLIISIDNAEERKYSVYFQPRHQRDESAIAQRNQEFEALIRKLLDRPYGAAPWVITTHALARGYYQDDIPPDPLYEIWRSHIWSFIPQGVDIPTHPPVEIDPMLSALFERPAQVYDPENPPDVPKEYDPNYGRRRARKSVKAKTNDFTSYTVRVNHRALPKVWRDIELAEDQTMEDLHLAIQQAFGWYDDHLYSFFMNGKAWDSNAEIGCPWSESMLHTHQVQVGQLDLKEGQKLLYLFDYGDSHEFDVKVIRIDTNAEKGEYPRLVAQQGDSPPQYPDYDEETEEYDWD
jgi:hypothetical protein